MSDALVVFTESGKRGRYCRTQYRPTLENYVRNA